MGEARELRISDKINKEMSKAASKGRKRGIKKQEIEQTAE
jgi:hypothetical protein